MMSPEAKPTQTFEELQRAGAAALKNSSSPMIDSRVLLKFLMGFDDADFLSRGADPVEPKIAACFAELIARRQTGEPVAYITGVKEFWSLPFRVTPDVLIPRDDSECLIEEVLARRSRSEVLRILDLGVGSGCLLCALLSEYPKSTGVGVDRSEAALDIARANAKSLGYDHRAHFALSNWLDSIGGVFDVIVANPPYIPEADRDSMMRDVALFEPAEALFAGTDGLKDYTVILDGLARSRDVLAADGLLVFEAGDGQTRALANMVKNRFSPPETAQIQDLKGLERGLVVDFRQCEKRD